MRLRRDIALIATLLFTHSAANAQRSPEDVPVGVASLPSCATPALLQILKDSSCAATDSTCLCSYPDIREKLIAAATTSCSNTADQQNVARFAKNFCPQKTTAGKTATTRRRPGTTTVGPTRTGQPGATEGWLYPTAVTAFSTAGLEDATMTAKLTGGASDASSPTTTIMASPGPIGKAGSHGKPGLASLFGLAAAVVAMSWAFAEL